MSGLSSSELRGPVGSCPRSNALPPIHSKRSVPPGIFTTYVYILFHPTRWLHVSKRVCTVASAVREVRVVPPLVACSSTVRTGDGCRTTTTAVSARRPSWRVRPPRRCHRRTLSGEVLAQPRLGGEPGSPQIRRWYRSGTVLRKGGRLAESFDRHRQCHFFTMVISPEQGSRKRVGGGAVIGG